MDKFISYASNFEDVMLWRALKSATPGFYVDIGAHHPVVDSVTMAFYERGWRGINVEPIRHLHEMLVQDRPRDINVCAAASSSGGSVEFYDVVGTGLSTTNPQIAQQHKQAGYEVCTYSVAMMTLESIYESYNISEVHFLKIDVEGAEADVLRGSAFDKVRPWVVIVEATEPNTQIPTHELWESLLIAEEFKPVYFDGVNRYYLSKDHPELAEFFHVPPNVFDDFIQYPCWRAQQGIVVCEKHVREIEKQIKKLLSTWSWRLTKPFRAPFVLFKALVERYKGF